MDKTACAFTGHRPHKFPWKGDEADLRCVALKAGHKPWDAIYSETLRYT